MALVPQRCGVRCARGRVNYMRPGFTQGVWANVEAMGIEDSPYGSVLYVYSAGQSGLLLQSQFLLRF